MYVNYKLLYDLNVSTLPWYPSLTRSTAIDEPRVEILIHPFITIHYHLLHNWSDNAVRSASVFPYLDAQITPDIICRARTARVFLNNSRVTGMPRKRIPVDFVYGVVTVS